MRSFLFQDWHTVMVTTSDIASIVQAENAWLDTEAFRDAFLWFDVTQLTATSGTLSLTLESAPLRDERLFTPLDPLSAVITLALTTTSQVIALPNEILAVPTARWLRWRITPSAGITLPWGATFRMHVVANRVARGINVVSKRLAPQLEELERQADALPFLRDALQRNPELLLPNVAPRDRALLASALAERTPPPIRARRAPPNAYRVPSGMRALTGQTSGPDFGPIGPGSGGPSAPILKTLYTETLTPTRPPPEARPKPGSPGAPGPEAHAMKLWQLTGGFWGRWKWLGGPPLSENEYTPTENDRRDDESVTDWDKLYLLPTRSRSVWSANIAGTDLGIPLAYKDKIIFFFGDTIPYDSKVGGLSAGDCYGWTERQQDVFAVPPWIRFFTTDETTKLTHFVSLTIKGVPGAPDDQPRWWEANHGPTGAFVDGDTAFVFFLVDVEDGVDGGPQQLQRTVVGRCESVLSGQTPEWRYVADMPSAIPRIVAPLLVDGSAIGLPKLGKIVLLYGTDRNYRASYAYLAYCPLTEFAPNPYGSLRSLTLKYLQHVDYSAGVPGIPHWTDDATLAMPLFSAAELDRRVGELQVVHDPHTDLYLMTGGGLPKKPNFNGVLLRWAPSPWGPWGSTSMFNPKTSAVDTLTVTPEPVATLYDRDLDHGFGNLIHRLSLDAKDEAGGPIPPCYSTVEIQARGYDADGDDRLGDVLVPRKLKEDPNVPSRDCWGGAYGGYLVVPWFRARVAGGKDLLDLVYTLNTWNPYQAMLMCTTFEVGATARSISITAGSVVWKGK